ncbi:MAG: hypothetical protein DRQ55_10025 [Planctomycetota bacterium]|nr:MAG: hypothetical protein DRQ55_10025 [Planctomycetota bacterium]
MRRSLLAPALVLACALLANWPALQGSFVYDDRAYVVENPVVQGAAPLWGSALGHAEQALWRPLTVASWRAQWHPGVSAEPFLLLNLILHAATALLVLRLGRRLGLSPWAAAVGAALFAVHPAHAEAIAWVTGRSELLATLLVCAAWWAHLSANRTAAWLALPLLALACASKENAFVAPALIGLGQLLSGRRGQPPSPGSRPRLAALFAVSGGMFLLRASVLPEALPAEGPYHQTPLAGRAGVALNVVGQAVKLLLAPSPLRIHYDRHELLGAQPTLLIATAALAMVALLLWRRQRMLACLLLGVPVALAPVLHLLPMGEPFAERFLYLPSVPFCLAAGGLLTLLGRREPRGPGLAVVLTGAALLAGLLASRQAVAVFRDDLSLWAHAARVAPDLAVVRFNHATFLERAGRFLSEDELRPGVADELRASLRLHPDHRYAAFAHQTLGHLALGALGTDLPDAVEASRHYHLALEKDPSLVDARLDLAGIALSRPDVVPLLEAQALAATLLAEPKLEPERRMAASQLLLELSAAPAAPPR